MNDSHILVVDDEMVTSHTLKEHLEQLGYRVTVAANCLDAKQLLEGPVKVDLMILDYLLPDGHGTDLLRSMGQQTALQRPRVIISSCAIDPDSASWEALRMRLPEVSRALIKAYVNKPYTFDSMDAMVNLILSVPDRQPSTNEVQSGDYIAFPTMAAPRATPGIS